MWKWVVVIVVAGFAVLGSLGHVVAHGAVAGYQSVDVSVGSRVYCWPELSTSTTDLPALAPGSLPVVVSDDPARVVDERLATPSQSRSVVWLGTTGDPRVTSAGRRAGLFEVSPGPVSGLVLFSPRWPLPPRGTRLVVLGGCQAQPEL